MQTAQTSPLNFFESKVFHPERFLPEGHPLYDVRFGGDQKEAFKPFSAGPRNCMGGKYVHPAFSIIITYAKTSMPEHSWPKLE